MFQLVHFYVHFSLTLHKPHKYTNLHREMASICCSVLSLHSTLLPNLHLLHIFLLIHIIIYYFYEYMRHYYIYKDVDSIIWSELISLQHLWSTLSAITIHILSFPVSFLDTSNRISDWLKMCIIEEKRINRIPNDIHSQETLRIQSINIKYKITSLIDAGIYFTYFHWQETA